MSDRYILGADGKTPVPAGDLIEWAKAYENRKKGACGPSPGASWAQVDRTQVSGGVYVSTVFLGLDHRFTNMEHGAPIVFETMIFGGVHDEWQDRCCTWDEAEALHAKAVRLAETSLAASFAEVEPRS